jgi:large subunit ribosomal protein L9e
VAPDKQGPADIYIYSVYIYVYIHIVAQGFTVVSLAQVFVSFPAKMKTLLSEESIMVPKGIKISIKAKQVEVTGKHGTLKRDFKHLPIEIFLAQNSTEVRARMYFAKSKQISALRAVCSHIQNLFDGVEKKFQYRMHPVYAHFPINANITNGGKTVEVRNFLGEKTVHVVIGDT